MLASRKCFSQIDSRCCTDNEGSQCPKQNVGVRSGGHLFPACSFLQDGVLINARSLNSSIDYDETTKVFCFGLGCLSHELAAFCVKINRFFPFGHSPTVGVGGFLLCGG
jgi:FAD/FMN-containing dehydrogenase